MPAAFAFALVSFLAPGEESLVVHPMYRSERPPPVRSARHVLLRCAGSLGSAASGERSREDALAVARSIAERARAGSDFVALAAAASQDPDAALGAVLGTFPPGVLAPALDEFLFSAELGTVSDPLVDERGVHVLQRIESHAAVRQILVRATKDADAARARCTEIAERLRAGADFAELARERSDDPESAARGGQYAIYERGPADTLLKAAAFELEVGGVAGPIESPIGWHFLQRVPLDAVDPRLAEASFVRLRGILLRVDESSPQGRDRAHALELADALNRRLRSGENMAKLARELDEDPGGRARDGDLGWVYRHQPGLSRELARACLLRVGELAEPLRTASGYLLVEREE